MDEFETEEQRELRELKEQLEELKRQRQQLTVEREEKEVVEQEKEEKEEAVEEELSDIRKSTREELETIYEQIKEFEKDIKQTAKEYENSYKKLKEVIDENEKNAENTRTLSEEEINELRLTNEKYKLDINENSQEIKRRLDALKKVLTQLKAKRTKMEKNITNAEALGLTYDEYKDITGTVRKTAIMNAILEEKGLSSIIEKKANERTDEEKELLKKTKEEIIREISELKKEHDDYSVLDVIEALYSLETTYTEVKKPKEYKFQSKELMNLQETSKELSYRVVNPYVTPNTDVVEEAPKDMENATENEKVDINELKPAEEKVTIFKDEDKYYVRKYAVERFKLKSADLGDEVRINGSLCYKINENDVEKIKENANNQLSPYIADVKEVSIDKKDDVALNTEEKVVDNGISPEDTKDELIPGTNIKRPRDRKTYETDEEYEEFLKNYYAKVFPQEDENTIKTNTEEELEEYITVEDNNKNERVTVFKDNDKYYVRKYAVDRYKLESANKDNEVRIEGSLCYEISLKDVEKLDNNKDNELSPYIVDIKETKVEKEELKNEDIESIIDGELNGEDIGEDLKQESDEEELDDDDIKDILEEELKQESEEELENNKEETSTEPEEELSEDEEELSEDDIEDVIEEELKATNIKASKEFKEELKKGGIMYNIVHAIPRAIKKLINKILGKNEALDAMMGNEEDARKTDNYTHFFRR